MKRRILSLGASALLCMVCIAVAVSSLGAAAPALASGTLSGEGSRTTEELTYNGIKTGVVRTEIKIPATSDYGLNVVNTIEFDLKNKNLTLEAINNGEYLESRKTVRVAANDFTAENDGKTVLAAVNGDLYMTAVHSHGKVNTGGTFTIPRGVQIIDGEIWSSQEINQEGLEATNAEKGNPASPKWALGMTKDFQPVVGVPKVTITIENKTSGKTIKTDGLNRLPAKNALIVYNQRVASSRALSDACEVVVEVDDDAFRHGSEMTGKVVAVYPKGQGGTAAISKNHLVLSARGNRVSRISGLKVGDVLTISTQITSDTNEELWQNCVSAICGHMPILVDGAPATGFDGTRWPYTLVGYKDDGTVMITVNDGRQSDYSRGVPANKLVDFCRELGYNTAFWFDGGGSTTLVTYDDTDDTCVVRNRPSDGSERAVANSMAVCWNDTPRGEQGSMDHIKVPVVFNPIDIDFPKGMDSSFTNGNNAAASVQDGNVIRLTATGTTDPYISFNFTNAEFPLNASEYKYIIMRLRTSPGASASKFQLFHCAGTNLGPSEVNSVHFDMNNDGEYQIIKLDLSDASGWKGNLNFFRMDFFDGVPKAGDYVEISNMSFAKTADEAALIEDNFAKGIYHMWDSGSITTPATPGHDGVKTYTCTHCGAKRTESIPAIEGMLGDVTLDGNVMTDDASCTLQHIAGWQIDANADITYADVNGDGTVDTKDATLILQYIAGWFDTFPNG